MPINGHAEAWDRLDECLRLSLVNADGDPAMLAWLIGGSLAGLGEQGFLDPATTTAVAAQLSKGRQAE